MIKNKISFFRLFTGEFGMFGGLGERQKKAALDMMDLLKILS